MLSKLFSKKDGDDNDTKNSQSEPPHDPPIRPPSTAVPPVETPPNVQGGILKPPQKSEGGIAVGRQKRITQRITVAITPPPAGSARAGLKITLPSAKAAPAAMPAMPPVSGNVEIPLSVIIPTLPAASLKEPAEQLLAGEMGSKTASLPLASILGMLPLGKIDFQLKELASYLPAAGVFKATDEFGDEICSLPLSEIVKRVPPELLARRSDQKPIDEKVQKMADPFSPESIQASQETVEPPPPLPEVIAPLASEAPPLLEKEIPIAETIMPPVVEEKKAEIIEPLPLPVEPPLAEEPPSMPEIPPVAASSEPPPMEIPNIDIGALAQQAMGATNPLSESPLPPIVEKPIESPIEMIPPTIAIDDFALPMDVPSVPKSPEESEKGELPKPEEAKPLVEEESSLPPLPIAKSETTESPLSQFNIPIPEEMPAAIIPPISLEAEKEIPAISPQPSKEEEIQPAGLESFSKAVEKLSQEEEMPAELPKAKEEPKFEMPPIEEKKPDFSAFASPSPTPSLTPDPIKAEPKAISEPLSAPLHSTAAKVNLNQCTLEELVNKANCPENIARKIIAWKELHGSFNDLHFLWNIPGMTTEVYRLLTGLPDEESAVELSDIFGLPAGTHLTVKDVSTRIRCWPFMNGCVIGGMEGLPIAFDCDDKKFAKAVCAFAPKLLQTTHDVLQEMNEPEAHEMHLMQEDKTISIFRYEHLILITINRRKGLSSRDVELLRQIVVKLSNVKGAKLEV